jgi:hypothetical protein
LKLNWLNGLADLRRAQQANHDLLAAQLQQQFGKPVLQPGEDMIAVESPITNHTHFHTQAPPTGVGIPTWLKTALVVVGLSGAAGLGSVLTAPQKPPGALLEAQSQTQPPAQTQNPTPRDRKYELDFWDPLELPRQ